MISKVKILFIKVMGGGKNKKIKLTTGKGGHVLINKNEICLYIH